jgi:hypothetical protein
MIRQHGTRGEHNLAAVSAVFDAGGVLFDPSRRGARLAFVDAAGAPVWHTAAIGGEFFAGRGWLTTRGGRGWRFVDEESLAVRRLADGRVRVTARSRDQVEVPVESTELRGRIDVVADVCAIGTFTADRCRSRGEKLSCR